MSNEDQKISPINQRRINIYSRGVEVVTNYPSDLLVSIPFFADAEWENPIRLDMSPGVLKLILESIRYDYSENHIQFEMSKYTRAAGTTVEKYLGIYKTLCTGRSQGKYCRNMVRIKQDKTPVCKKCLQCSTCQVVKGPFRTTEDKLVKGVFKCRRCT